MFGHLVDIFGQLFFGQLMDIFGQLCFGQLTASPIHPMYGIVKDESDS
jgi:hypothetical protein